MKRDLLFIAKQILPLLEEKCVEMVARNRGISSKERETPAKLLTVSLRQAEEGLIGSLIVKPQFCFQQKHRMMEARFFAQQHRLTR